MPKKLGNLVLYSVDDLHEILGVSKMTLRAYLREGRLKGKKLGVSWYVTEDAIRDYFNAPDEDTNVASSENTASAKSAQPTEELENATPHRYIVQGINDLVSETEECETIEEVLATLDEQPIISLFQISVIYRSTGKLVEVIKARDFIERYS